MDSSKNLLLLVKFWSILGKNNFKKKKINKINDICKMAFD